MIPVGVVRSPGCADTRGNLGVILYDLLPGHHPYPVVGDTHDVLKDIKETPTPLGREWDSSSGVTRREHKRLRPGTCPIDDEIQTIDPNTLAEEKERRYQASQARYLL